MLCELVLAGKGLLTEVARLRRREPVLNCGAPPQSSFGGLGSRSVRSLVTRDQAFVTQLAGAEAREETQLMQRRAEQVAPLLGFHCTLQLSCGVTMLELPGTRGSDGESVNVA